MTFLKIATALIVCYASWGANGEDLSTQQDFSDEELAQILAPIALYPDKILSHVLIAATYPLEVVQAERWITRNPNIEPADAVHETADKPWDTSVKALVQFPELLERLSDNLEWTQDLGDAFLEDEERLLASIQTLRQQANKAGSFDDVEQIIVVHEDDNIIIQPIETEVVYIPYYDTRVAYGSWHWEHYPPIYWERNSRGRHGYYSNRQHPIFSWHPTSTLSTHFLFGGFHWSNRYVVINNHGTWNTRSKHDRHNSRNFGKGLTHRWTHDPSHRRGVNYRHPKNKSHDRRRIDGSHRYNSAGNTEIRGKSAKNAARRHNQRTNLEVGSKHVRSQGEMRNSANHSNRRDFNVIQNRKTSNPKSNQATRNAYGKNTRLQLTQSSTHRKGSLNSNKGRSRHRANIHQSPNMKTKNHLVLNKIAMRK